MIGLAYSTEPNCMDVDSNMENLNDLLALNNIIVAILITYFKESTIFDFTATFVVSI